MKALYKQLEWTRFTWNGATWDLSTTNSEPPFQNLSANGPQVIYQGGYFDLAGLTQQEKTLFIQGLDIQMVFAPELTDGITGDAVSICVVLSDTPLDPTFTSYVAPGFSGGGIDAQNLIFHRWQTYAVTQDSSSNSKFTVLMNEHTGGVCTSTASDRIYWGVALTSNVVKIGPTTSPVTDIYYPQMRIKLFVNAAEEKEYEYLMRLKRSYDLQQSFDVDGNRPH